MTAQLERPHREPSPPTIPTKLPGATLDPPRPDEPPAECHQGTPVIATWDGRYTQRSPHRYLIHRTMRCDEMVVIRSLFAMQ